VIRLALAAAAAAALLVLTRVSTPAYAACDGTHDDFESVYCFAQEFQETDHTLNLAYIQLRTKLDAARQAALRTDELAWLQSRDGACGRHENGAFFVDFACANRMTDAHSRFLEGRYRDCVQSSCSDLDFYNTQDVAQPDRGPKLTRYPTISKYHGSDAGYIAVYTHDPANTLYPVGGNNYVAGFIRLRGHYEGRVFQPEGYENKDISADPNFKELTESLFPGHRGGTWAGGDTGGFIDD
jgi:uncharacterized protein YecT (DUF1311 family)